MPPDIGKDADANGRLEPGAANDDDPLRVPGSQASDQDLVDAVNRGERDAFVGLYERHRDFVHAVAWRMLGDRDLAAEAVQETFLHWLGRFPGFELRARVTTYLYPVVRSVSVEIARRRRRALRVSEGIVEEAPAGPVPAEGSDSEVGTRLARLPASQQEVVLLRYAHGLELHEIAAALEIPLGTVKSRLHAAVKRLNQAG